MFGRLFICLIAGLACAPACARDRAAKPVKAPPPIAEAESRGMFTLPEAATPSAARPVAVSLKAATAAEVRRSPDLLNADRSWLIDPVSGEATSDAGASFAVREAFDRMPKPRVRKSALSAALVLRIDGQEDSPLFSVGGGGVAAAMWKMRPQ
jgi:hypothetical protein